jgi:hypothetical protein
MSEKGLTEAKIVDLLAQKYPAPAWAFFPQVRNSTGYAKFIRTADALAFSLWPSRGYFCDGFEIKVSRGDWHRELAHPGKAEEMAMFCDHWWIVAPKGVVQDGELPPGWGLLEVREGKLVKVHVPNQTHETTPWTPAFIAAVMRRAAEVVTPTARLQEILEKGRKEGQEFERKATSYTYKRLTEEVVELKKAILDFERASGIEIKTWGNKPAEVGAIVRLVLNGGYRSLPGLLRRFSQDAMDFVKTVEKGLEDAGLALPKEEDTDGA